MRFAVELLLENDRVPKDKNRIILSILKNNFNSYNKEYYESLYEKTNNNIKDFTFSLYMGQCQFLREEIVIPEKKIILNFSAHNYEDGIMFYNSFLSNIGRSYPIKDNAIKVSNISMRKEKTIYGNEVIFKTMSPLVAREHRGDNKKTWYHSLRAEEGQVILKENISYQLNNVFGERAKLDIEEIDIEVSQNIKEVKVKNYGIEILGNIGLLKINAKPYLLDYLYKAGIGSKRSSGFGMVDIV
ncbi:CRISPR-associated endoribonuclease Cas6 [Gottschalkia acidurici 9a]|uniref:CRISPR-associated endoribonuclease Cas6 n=1 Tax=Gottschalkia acidurici (strain ATCC 7906 / DSM 604 / BCRC 14475 / CIP 104303 / KCTC 5404 / NCIMB 10678 / 9a) TaxID=1128398 RepID=K0AY46_GOTA9|nr:CRISPR-associated endoribonuclease Cas6 [Gottschalkia acidurici]AFS77692.1 CRISPR-associated endoribonuclease Cas6 [Gottschalkia acidurici 9a]